MHKYGPNAVGCESQRVSTLCEPAMNKSVEMDTSSKAVTGEKMFNSYKRIVIFSIGTFLCVAIIMISWCMILANSYRKDFSQQFRIRRLVLFMYFWTIYQDRLDHKH